MDVVCCEARRGRLLPAGSTGACATLSPPCLKAGKLSGRGDAAAPPGSHPEELTTGLLEAYPWPRRALFRRDRLLNPGLGALSRIIGHILRFPSQQVGAVKEHIPVAAHLQTCRSGSLRRIMSRQARVNVFPGLDSQVSRADRSNQANKEQSGFHDNLHKACMDKEFVRAGCLSPALARNFRFSLPLGSAAPTTRQRARLRCP